MFKNKSINEINFSKIIAIQFSILSPEEIINGSVAKITSRETKPVIGGIFDPRMGVLDRGMTCPTDGLDNIQTPGYFGHIQLARPVFYIQYLNIVINVLRCICFKCSKLKLSKEKHKHILNWTAEERWKYIFALSNKINRCGEDNENGCGCLQPFKIKKEGLATIIAEWKNTSSNKEDEIQNIVIKVTPEMFIKIFKRISDEDVSFMGFSPIWSRPDWMICQVLSVPPPAVRPSVKHDSQQKSEDDLTHILINIIKSNKTLQDKINNNAPANIIDDWTTVVQYYIATMVDNKIPGVAAVAQRSGRPLKSIKERLNGKSGRMRGNLMAKRVDYSARSVITADSNISIKELGIPMKIAKNITKPVIVNSYNKNYLTKLVQNGPDIYPGAKILERKNGESITLRYVDRNSIILEDGDKVHRHMMDGDPVIFNRQPTLHRMSMQCHIARVMEIGDTFRLNVAVTKPYNADFDGDEMNLHMPQDIESDAELLNLAAVPFNIISPANNSPIIGIFQDSMLGSYLFTRKHINFNKETAMNLLMSVNNVDTNIFKNKQQVSNFDLLTQILPPFSLKTKNKQFDDDEDKNKSNNIIEIINGNYIRGQLDKGILGGGSKGIIHRICNDFGNQASADFIDNLQRLITDYMTKTSFSVGISDLLSDNTIKDKIINVITDKKNRVKDIIDQTQIGIFENETGKTNQEEFETRVNNILNQATSEAGKIALTSLNKDNHFVIMVNAGSKGSDLNIAQMTACLGQQNVDGRRIPYGFEHRTLPHYTKYDDSPNARGFVENSYINGLTPNELFFHAMGGRVGLIDTAVKTSSTGYIQRRLIKSMEDLMVRYDGTVRSNKDYIIQFSYGDDGIDTTKVENQELRLVNMSIQEIYSHFNIPEDMKPKILNNIFIKEKLTAFKKELKDNVLIEKLKGYTDMMLKSRNEIVENVFKNKDDFIVRVPVAFSHIINNILGQQNINSNSLVDITFLEAFEIIENNYNKLEKIYYFPPRSLFKVLYYFYLSPKELLINKRFNKNSLILLLENINLFYKKSIVAPGEMVGMIAAQSIGEPTTQLTLNSVTFETPIMVRNSNNEIQKVQIGQFIEDNIKTSPKIEYMKDKDTTYAELKDYYEVPSCDEDGNVSWKKIEAVTRHPVVNEDGTNVMLKITTKEQREVIATKAKSFLKLTNGKLIATNGSELKVGDYLPVSKKQINFEEKYELDLKSILPPNEYIYTSEMEKAKSVMNETFWWKKHSNKTFILPYSRSDSVVSKITGKREGRRNMEESFKPNCVYMKNNTMNVSCIPETIPLDYNFGYLVGAYAAEGCMTKHQISISNNDYNYFEPILKLCHKWNITTKKYKRENFQGNEGWTSQDLRIYNTMLCRLLEIIVGKLSHNKFISDKFIFSNKECLKGFLDGYIGGDGSIDIRSKTISISSVSKNMLIDTQQILNIFGIYSFITKPKKAETNNRGSKDIKQPYTICIVGNQIKSLANILNIKINYKQNALQDIINHTYMYEINRNNTIIPNEVDGKIIFEERTPDKYEDIIFDRIISIEEVSNTTNYAFDLTVEETRTFMLWNNLLVFDTFHSAGISSKSNVTRGVPRIEEILTVSAHPKNPSLTVFLKPQDETNKDIARNVMYMLEHTELQDLVKSIEICFDPDDLNTLIEEDKETITQYKEFENIFNDCIEQQNEIKNDNIEKSKWILRIELEPSIMLQKNITMDDIHFTLKNSYGQTIQCIFSDYNSDKLIFRIRMNNIIKQKTSTLSKKIKVNPLDQTDQIYFIKNFQEELLKNIVLRGVRGIDKVILRKLKDNKEETSGIFVKKEIWVLDTIGTNLLEVLGLNYINQNKTFSNDIVETFNVLGIEAARQVIYNELSEVLEFDGTYINYHHMALLVDRMTYASNIISVFRHGINNDDTGPIAKASFEETNGQFLRAARHAELDNMRGVSANVMVGSTGFYGTSSFDIVLDMNYMSKLEENSKISFESEEENIEKLFKLSQKDKEGYCSIQNIKIDNNIININTKNLGDMNDNYNPF